MIRGLDLSHLHAECWLVASGPSSITLNKPLPSVHPESGPNPETSTLALLGGRMPPVRMGSGNDRAEPRTTFPSKQLLPLTLERSFCHRHPRFVQTSQDHRRGFGTGYWMSEEKQKRMKLHHRGLANRLHGLGPHSAEAPSPRPAANDPGGCDGTRTIAHEEMCNTPCPIATLEDSRRQLCDRSKEDAADRAKHSTRSALQPRCPLVGGRKLEKPTQRSWAVWSPQPPSALLQDGVIQPSAPHITDTSTSGVQTSTWFLQVSDHCILIMEGSSGDFKVG